MPEIHIATLQGSALEDARNELVNLLRSCVHSGASLGFLAPLPESDAADYWRGVEPQIEAGSRIVVVARDGGAGPIVGSAQLGFESRPNGRHRAEVGKVMVLPSYRRRGIAARLMNEVERHARDRAIRVLVLDTSEGPGGARGFYEALDYRYVGGIPDYALDPDGRPTQNAIYFKALSPPPATRRP